MQIKQDDSPLSQVSTSPFNLSLSSEHILFEHLIPTQENASRLTMYEKSIRTLPQPPALWQTFQRACDKGASSKQLGKIIKDDPVLSAAILRMANAPGLGVRIAIHDIGRAIAHLGTSLVRSIVSRHSFSGAFKGKGQIYDIHRLWKHGIAVSAFAEIIAEHIPKCDAEKASTLGLFHDIGKMSLNLFTQYKQPATLDTSKGHLVYENQRFACNHIELGVLLAKHWELPDNIIQGLAYHHHPAYAELSNIPEHIRPEVVAVYLADLMAIYLSFDAGDSGITMPHESYACMLPNATLMDIINSQKVQDEVKRIQQVEF